MHWCYLYANQYLLNALVGIAISCFVLPAEHENYTVNLFLTLCFFFINEKFSDCFVVSFLMCSFS